MTLTLLMSSCDEKKNTGVTSTFNNQIITIKNANTTLSVDNDINFEISYKKNDEIIPLTDKTKESTSIFLIDSVNNIVSFTRKAARLNEVNDKFGEGKIIKIEALSHDGKIKCYISLSSYNKLPNVILVQSSFINMSEKSRFIKDYGLNQIHLQHPDLSEPKWWTFHGGFYDWANDFTFQLPESFSSENYMGLNPTNRGFNERLIGGGGGGIPLVDVWNKEFGLALASLGEKPSDISLPIKVEHGKVSLEIMGNYKNQLIMPGDSLVSVQTAIIVHQNDFYDAIRMYSKLMKPLLPDFQKPPDLAYQPEWCTWGYNRNFKPEQIIGKLEQLKALGIGSVIIDDGWSVKHGDWIPDPQKFPNGEEDFKEFINKIHESGLKAQLWWVPGYYDSTSFLVAQHPDWLIKNKDGSVYSPSWRSVYPQTPFGLCPAYQPVQEHYKKLVQKFVEEFKLDGFKLDFPEINIAPPCYNPKHHHVDPFESFYSTPKLFQIIYETATRYNPDMVLEYCPCSLVPTIFHLPWINLMTTSDPHINQITKRIKLYKALLGDEAPVLEEYCGVQPGPIYELTIGTGGVPGTFSRDLDNYHEKWLNIYQKYQLSKGEYLNLYDIGFDYPEAHVIKKDDKFYYAFYTHPWKQLGPRPWKPSQIEYPKENYSGKLEFRGLDKNVKYRIVDYVNNKELGIIKGNEPLLDVSFVNYLLLKATPYN